MNTDRKVQQRAIRLGRRIRNCGQCSREYLCAKHEAELMKSVRDQAERGRN